MAQQQRHPVFDDIDDGRLEEVQRRVRADAAVLEERRMGMTPLVYAIWECKPAIVLWLIEHRGQHDLDSTDDFARTALHWACEYGLLLSVVQALVVAGANPAALDEDGSTPLTLAACNNHTNIVAFLLQQPAVKATIDTIDTGNLTALSLASRNGRLSIVQPLLDAGADPTIPAGQYSPLNRAITRGHTDIAALLRTAIAEPDRARALHKARALLDAALAIPEARNDSADEGNDEPQAVQQQQQQEAIAAAPAYLKGRVAEGRELPAVVVVVDDNNAELVACVKYALGLEGGGGVHEEGEGPPPQGMVDDVFIELLGFTLPRWADKGPEEEEEEGWWEEEEEDEDDDEEEGWEA